MRTAQINILAPPQLGDVVTLEQDFAAHDFACTGKQPDNGSRRRRLPRTGLAHNSDGLTGIDTEVCLAHGGNHAGGGLESNLQIDDFQQGYSQTGFHCRAGLRAQNQFVLGIFHLRDSSRFIDTFQFLSYHRHSRSFCSCLAEVICSVAQRYFLAFGSRASRTTSPIMMKLKTVMARAPAG